MLLCSYELVRFLVQVQGLSDMLNPDPDDGMDTGSSARDLWNSIMHSYVHVQSRDQTTNSTLCVIV